MLSDLQLWGVDKLDGAGGDHRRPSGLHGFRPLERAARVQPADEAAVRGAGYPALQPGGAHDRSDADAKRSRSQPRTGMTAPAGSPRLAADGFRLRAWCEMRARSSRPRFAADWPDFAASWDDLGLDTYMADGGRYRKRRHAAFGARRGRADPPQAAPAALPEPRLQSAEWRHRPLVRSGAAGDRRRPEHDDDPGDLPDAVRAPGADARLAHRGAPVPHRGAQRRSRAADAGRHAPRRRGLRAGAADRPAQHPERRHLDPRRRMGATSAASRWPSRSTRLGWTTTASCTG